jgi:flagellar biosynthesis protein FlhG
MFLNAADDVVVITVPDPAAITDAYATIKTIATAIDDVYLIMNQVKNEKEAIAVYNKIKKVALTNIGEKLNLKLIGKINLDSKISSAVRKRTLFSAEHPNSAVNKDMVAIANKIMLNLERDMLVKAGESGLTGFFKRLIEEF